MIYELRIYRIRPGRMADGLRRFDRLPPIFERNGIRNLGRWQCAAGPDGPAIAYLLGYNDFAEREVQWESFYHDPDWLALRADTNAGEEMVERFDLMFLKPSPAWQPEAGPTGSGNGLHELRIFRVGVGQVGRAGEFFAQAYLPAVARAGGQTMLFADLMSGADLPAAAVITAWPDAAAREVGVVALENDPVLAERFRADRAAQGGEAVGPARCWLLQPIEAPLPRNPLVLGAAERQPLPSQ